MEEEENLYSYIPHDNDYIFSGIFLMDKNDYINMKLHLASFYQGQM